MKTIVTEVLWCDFCGLNVKDIKLLIKGNRVAICDKCVEVCNKIIKEKLTKMEQDNV